MLPEAERSRMQFHERLWPEALVSAAATLLTVQCGAVQRRLASRGIGQFIFTNLILAHFNITISRCSNNTLKT